MGIVVDIIQSGIHFLERDVVVSSSKNTLPASKRNVFVLFPLGVACMRQIKVKQNVCIVKIEMVMRMMMILKMIKYKCRHNKAYLS